MTRLKRGGWAYSTPPNCQFTANKQSPQALGLLAWWPTLASYGSDTLRDLLGAHSGALSAGTTWAAHGELGWMAEFTGGGAADGITVTDHAALQIAGGDFTFSFWFTYTLASDAFPRFINYRYNAGADGWAFQLYTANPGRIAFIVRRAGVETRSRSSFLLTPSALAMITGVIKSGTTYIYINGVDASTDVAGGSINAADLQIGGIAGGAHELAGLIGDVRLYDRALSPTEVFESYYNPWELYRPAIPTMLASAPVVAAAIMNQIQFGNLGADLYDGALIQ